MGAEFDIGNGIAIILININQDSIQVSILRSGTQMGWKFGGLWILIMI